MMKHRAVVLALIVATAVAHASAQQPPANHAPAQRASGQQAEPLQTAPLKPAPKPLTFPQRIRQLLSKTSTTFDDARGTPDMVVSNYLDPKGGKTTIVIVNDRRRNLLGFYVYNFGSIKDAKNKDEVYRYLLDSNDAISIGTFF